jgi:hypothetical protein
VYFRGFRLVVAFVLLFVASTGHAQISKANQIFIERGLQVQGTVTTYAPFHLSTLSNANYTAATWLFASPPSYSGPYMPLLGDAPGFPWSRFVADENDMPPQGDEGPYLPQLVSLQLGDEPNLDDTATRERMVNWFNAVSSNWPNTILYNNNGGGQVAISNLMDFVSRGHPDMISFDFYPWRSVYDTNRPNHTGPPLPGNSIVLYSELGIYRQISCSNGIPYGCYVQTFHSVEDYDSTIYRDPSASELRLNHFAPLAFNAKMLIDFHYNNGVSSLFSGGDGDNNPSALYYEKADCAKRVRNMGNTLVRLKPIDAGFTSCDANNPGNTSIVLIRGRTASGSLNTIPLNFCAGTGGNAYTDWTYQRNDPYLTNNWTVSNKGTKNNGQPGDVIASWFKTMDETFDGPDYTNEVYMMVVNGLSDPTGSAEDCLQEIKLNFKTNVTTLQVLNPETGLVETWYLPLVSGFRQLALYLNGGDAALFKFDDGAPFIGAASTGGAPVIVGQPQSRTNVPGSDALFSVVVSGSGPMTYQWHFNGVDIAGATTNSYVRTSAQSADAGSYSVTVSNSQGTNTSAVAQLTIQSLLLYEPFDYSTIGVAASSTAPANWTLSGTSGTDDFLVNGGSLFYPGLPPSVGNSATNGGGGLGVRRLFSPAVSSGTIYFSVLFKMLDFGFGTWTGASTQIAALTSDDNTSFRLQVMMRSNSASGVVFGVQKGGTGSTITWDTTEHRTNETVFAVGKYDFTMSPNRATLWINPTASAFGGAEPATGSISSTTGTNGLTIDRFNFRQNTSATVPAAMEWDELRIATTWASAAPAGMSHIDLVELLPDGRVQFTASVNAPSVIIQSRADLSSGAWSDIATVLTPNGKLDYAETVGTGVRFYRLKLGP